MLQKQKRNSYKEGMEALQENSFAEKCSLCLINLIPDKSSFYCEDRCDKYVNGRF